MRASSAIFSAGVMIGHVVLMWDRKLVLEVVRQNGVALRYASAELKAEVGGPSPPLVLASSAYAVYLMRPGCRVVVICSGHRRVYRGAH